MLLIHHDFLPERRDKQRSLSKYWEATTTFQIDLRATHTLGIMYLPTVSGRFHVLVQYTPTI